MYKEYVRVKGIYWKYVLGDLSILPIIMIFIDIVIKIDILLMTLNQYHWFISSFGFIVTLLSWQCSVQLLLQTSVIHSHKETKHRLYKVEDDLTDNIIIYDDDNIIIYCNFLLPNFPVLLLYFYCKEFCFTFHNKVLKKSRVSSTNSWIFIVRYFPFHLFLI